jgi:cytochrome c2
MTLRLPFRAAALLAVSTLIGCEGGRTDYLPPAFTGGNAHKGAAAIAEVGCGACHVIPGIRGARGVVGPSLDGFAQRTFIAGQLPNTPGNLTTWILNPHAVEPQTAMPALDLDPGQARDIAAFLYTLN